MSAIDIFSGALTHSMNLQFIPYVYWVAAGTGTTSLAYSPDGKLWIPTNNNPFSTAGYGIAYSGTTWVSTGSGGNSLAYSYDGITWTKSLNNPFSTAGYGIAYDSSHSTWVSVGQDAGGNSLAYSTNGITWTASTNNPFTTAGYGVAWNGNMWVAVGGGGNAIAASYEGKIWVYSVNNPFDASCVGIAWNGSIWVAAANSTGTGNCLAYSNNGMVWTLSTNKPFSSSATSIAWNSTNSTWVAAGSGGNCLAYSSDAKTWTASTNVPFSKTGSGVAWNGSLWVADGSGGNSLAYSTNGQTWTQSTNNPFLTSGQGVASKVTLYNTPPTITPLWVTRGYAGQAWASSNNGTTWTTNGSQTTGMANDSTTYCLRWNGFIWVCTDNYGILYSPDGINWSAAINKVFNSNGTPSCRGIAWDGSIWVACGIDQIASGLNDATTAVLGYSIDGRTWTKSTNNLLWGNYDLNFVNGAYCAAGNGTRWVAGGNVGGGGMNLVYSSDAKTWTGCNNTPIGLGGIVKTVAWNGSMWVAGGQPGGTGAVSTLAYSTDGLTWTGATTSPFGVAATSGQALGLAWGNSRWVVAGQGGNHIGYSTNGITWTSSTNAPFNGNANDVTWNGSVFIIAGSSNTGDTLAYSSDGLTWTLLNHTTGGYGQFVKSSISTNAYRVLPNTV